MAIHPDLMELIRCPQCHGQLRLRPTDGGLECAACKLVYPVVDDIPQLLIEEAKPLKEEEAPAPPKSPKKKRK